MVRKSAFDVARQPIVDRLGRSVAYELLFRHDGGGHAEVRDSAGASSQVISRTFRQIGADTALGRSAAFINFDEEGLWSPTLARLPRERVVLELLETLEVSDRIVHRCADLKARGFRLALSNGLGETKPLPPLTHCYCQSITCFDVDGRIKVCRLKF